LTVAAEFGPSARLMVRSSANCEDLEQYASAGLYVSVPNVAVADVASAVREVWASLWSRRAVASRKQAGIPEEQARMGVLIQPMLTPNYAFILHTTNPINRNPSEVYAELAVGLGEILASASAPGTPYRLVCDKKSGAVETLAFASFSHALFPAPADGVGERTLDYSQVTLSCDAAARRALGRRLCFIGKFVEEALGQPQDIEGAVVGNDIYLVQARPQQGLTA
jgi:phosphoglucan, water dikinase